MQCVDADEITGETDGGRARRPCVRAATRGRQAGTRRDGIGIQSDHGAAFVCRTAGAGPSPVLADAGRAWVGSSVLRLRCCHRAEQWPCAAHADMHGATTAAV